VLVIYLSLEIWLKDILLATDAVSQDLPPLKLSLNLLRFFLALSILVGQTFD
jgi:hypothetical protein